MTQILGKAHGLWGQAKFQRVENTPFAVVVRLNNSIGDIQDDLVTPRCHASLQFFASSWSLRQTYNAL